MCHKPHVNFKRVCGNNNAIVIPLLLLSFYFPQCKVVISVH